MKNVEWIWKNFLYQMYLLLFVILDWQEVTLWQSLLYGQYFHHQLQSLPHSLILPKLRLSIQVNSVQKKNRFLRFSKTNFDKVKDVLTGTIVLSSFRVGIITEILVDSISNRFFSLIVFLFQTELSEPSNTNISTFSNNLSSVYVCSFVLWMRYKSTRDRYLQVCQYHEALLSFEISASALLQLKLSLFQSQSQYLQFYIFVFALSQVLVVSSNDMTDPMQQRENTW